MILPLLLAAQIFIDGKEINAPGDNPCIPLDVLVNALGAKVEVRSNETEKVIEVTRPPAAPVPARPTHYGPAIKGALTWLHDVYKLHEPDFGAEVCLAKAEGAPCEQSTVADEHGFFVFTDVEPGDYVLVMHSRHAKDTGAAERHGKIRTRHITVRAGETLDASFNFGRTAYPEEQ